MDFLGMKLAEQIYTAVILVCAAVAFLAGYLNQNFSLMMTVFAAGVVLACALSVPDWPMFNKHPLQWLPPPPQPRGTAEQQPSGARGKKKKEASWSNFWNLF